MRSAGWDKHRQLTTEEKGKRCQGSLCEQGQEEHALKRRMTSYPVLLQGESHHGCSVREDDQRCRHDSGRVVPVPDGLNRVCQGVGKEQRCRPRTPEGRCSMFQPAMIEEADSQIACQDQRDTDPELDGPDW